MEAEPLTMFGAVADADPVPWDWVVEQLTTAGTYWVVPAGTPPRPRPVWGVWDDGRLVLSVGSPAVNQRLDADPQVVVHVGDGIDVVLVEGRLAERTKDARALALYAEKYDHPYDAERYGPLAVVTAERVLAWRAAGEHGRDGFHAASRFRP